MTQNYQQQFDEIYRAIDATHERASELLAAMNGGGGSTLVEVMLGHLERARAEAAGLVSYDRSKVSV